MPPHAAEPQPVASPAVDPVCGMKVDRVRAVRVDHVGATYYVCSEDCRARFEADPERYVTERASQDIDAGHALDASLAEPVSRAN